MSRCAHLSARGQMVNILILNIYSSDVNHRESFENAGAGSMAA